MYRYYFIAKSNIRRQKSDMATFFILSFIAAALIYVSATFLIKTGDVIDTAMEKINAADLLVMISDDEAAVGKLAEIIKGNRDLTGYEATKYLRANAKYRRKGEKNWTEYSFAIASYEDERRLQKISCATGRLHGNMAVIPVSLSGSYPIGDTMELKIGDNIYPLKVAAYNEDNIYCSPMNMGTYLIYVSEKLYNGIGFENPQKAEPCKLVKTCISRSAKSSDKEGNDYADDLFNEFNDWYSAYCRKHPGYGLSSMNFLPADLMKTASLILPFIFIAIILVFAVIIFAIALVIIHFSVKNFIMLNLKNTAIMEAGGYTVKELVLILLFQLLMVSGLGCLAGIAAGALLLKPAGIVILITLGLSWNQGISFGIGLGVLAVFFVIITILTLFIGREYSKTPVLSALHGIYAGQGRVRNCFSFEHTPLPIPLTMALKDTFGKFRSRLGIIFIMAILSVSMVIGFGIVDSYARSDESLLQLSGIFECDATVDGNETMLNNVAAMSTVDAVYGDVWYAFNYSTGRRLASITTRAFTDTSAIKGGCVLEGHWPENENEILLASAAADSLGAGMGDSVTVKNFGREETYRVCGLCQTLNNMGMMAYMTIGGYERVAVPATEYGLWIMLKKGCTFRQFKEEFEDTYPDVEVTDYKEATAGTLGMISGGMKLIAVFIAAITVVIVAFVVSLIVRAQITREWRNIGVRKALGFTSGQLIRETMLSNMPAISMGVVIGLALSPTLGADLMKSAFTIFGFRKALFEVYPLSYLLTVVLICGIAMATAAWLGRRIRSLEVVKMITEE